MKHYLVYHNESRWDVVTNLQWIETNKRLDDAVGQRIWVLSGDKEKREYSLIATFLISKIEARPSRKRKYQIYGDHIQMFEPSIRIDTQDWFGEFQSYFGNFAFGLQRIRDSRWIAKLEAIQQNAAAELPPTVRLPHESPSRPSLKHAASIEQPVHKLARISFNSSDWWKPTGDARKCEATNTYNYKQGFGHEDWLFRTDWVVDGWRYAFIEGVNRSPLRHSKEVLNLTLFTIDAEKRRRFVANIYEVECLDISQAEDALAVYRDKDWYATMEREIAEIGGNPKALGDSKWVTHVLNVRFRQTNVDRFPPNCFASPDDVWLRKRHRYQLYDLQPEQQRRLEQALPGRRGTHSAPSLERIFRRGMRSVEITPEHRKMQAKLLSELKREFGATRVVLEEDFVDVTVRTDQEKILFEIKTDLEPRTVIRNALGQVLEYAYHPLRKHELPVRLVIVGRVPLNAYEAEYLGYLKAKHSLPLEYRVVSL